MNKLISANFMRLKKNTLFWAGIIFMCLFAALLVLGQYHSYVKYDSQVTLDNIFFAYALLIGMLSAVFCSLFFGTEYSDGTIRNKIIIGHTRMEIYFSNLMTNIVVSFLFCLVFLITAAAVGTPLIGFLTLDARIILLFLLGTFVLTAAYASIFTLISMVCGNKAAVAVISILLVVVLLLVATSLNGRLEAPEFYNGIMLADSQGNMTSQSIPNPTYLKGTARAVVQFIYDFLPTGQSIQYSSMAVLHAWQLPLYSFFITVVSAFTGAAVFHKKDIK